MYLVKCDIGIREDLLDLTQSELEKNMEFAVRRINILGQREEPKKEVNVEMDEL